jgi:conjugative relaxase-like TrwC/TraI family protein
MLSLSPGGMTAANASKYFAQDDYYLRGGEPSQWIGKGSEVLGLEGQVQEADFRKLAEGKAPDGTRLVKPKTTRDKAGSPVETHRAGNDLTWSAPKSVSVAYAAGDQEVKEIWDRSVMSAMGHVEEHYSNYRTPDGTLISGNIVAAKIDHVTSRALDPDVHSHVFLFNLTRNPQGKWKANEPKNIYTDKISLGILVRQEAIHRYRQAGYEVYITDRDQLFFEIKGVSAEEMEFFSKRSAAIAERVANWLEEKRFPGVSEGILNQMAALGTRDHKRLVTWEDVRRTWDKGFETIGTTSRELLERVQAAKHLPGAVPVRADSGPGHAPDDFRYKAPGEYPETLATVIHHTKVPKLKKQPGYEAAKRGGDMNAARDVVHALVRREVVDGIKRQIPENAAIYIVPVAQREGPYLNMLAAAYAERLAEDLGGEVWTRIAKVSGGCNTGATVNERMHNRQVFRGELPPENSVIIIADDTFTVGGTLTALVDHLAREGNTPLCATTLATGRYGKKLAPTQELINGLFKKAGIDENQFKDEFGYSPHSLTGAEIRSYLHNGASGIDGARARFFAGGTGEGPGHPKTQTAILNPDLPNDHPKNSGAVIREAAAFLTDREAVFDRAELLKVAAQISGGEHSLPELNAAEDGWAGRKNGIVRMGRESHGWQAGKEFYTTRAMLELEAGNIETLKNLGPFKSVTSRGEVEAYLAGLSGEERGEHVAWCREKYPAAYQVGFASLKPGAAGARQNRIFLSEGQQQHVMNELAGIKGFAITQGDPGTGKTFCAEIIERFNRDVLQPSGRNHYTLNLAYTGKAALEMSKANGKPAYTIDSFLNRFHQGKIKEDILEQIAPNGTQVIIKVDEASFVGGRQAAYLLQALEEIKAQGVESKLVEIGDRKQMQSIQASPFLLHATDLARQGAGDYAELKEINRQKDFGLRQVAEVLNRDGLRELEHGERGDDGKQKPLDAQQQLGANAQEAITMLEAQGRMREIPERKELIQAAVSHYLAEAGKPNPDLARAAAGEKQSVLLITPLNLDRTELNDRIRKARQEAGELGPGQSFAVSTQVRQGVTTASFKAGMTLVFSGERGQGGKMQAVPGTYLNQQGEIQSVNPEANTITVRLRTVKKSDLDEGKTDAAESTTRHRDIKAARNITRTFDAAQLSGRTTLFQSEQRELAQGDRIIFRKNTKDKSVETPEGKKAEVRNDETGEIEKLSSAGTHTVALIKLDDGRRINLQLDRFGPQHLDHGYAVTVYGAQGGTVDSVIPFLCVKPGTENDRGELESLTGVKLSDAQFRQWGSELSGYERGYRGEVKIGEHTGDISFIMIRDRYKEKAQKGVAVIFHNGLAMVADKDIQIRMREAGMYWSRNAKSWVTAATNDQAMKLMDRHPLNDSEYFAQLAREFAGVTEKKPEPVQKTGPGDGNAEAEIDTTTEAAKFGRASYNTFDVALTRARHEAVVFTNSVSGLKKAVLSVDEKTSTIENRLTREIAGFYGKLTRDMATVIKPAREIKQPQVRSVQKFDPGLELKR